MAKHRVLFFVQDFGASGAEKVALNIILQLSKDSDFVCGLVVKKTKGALLSLLPQNVEVFHLNQTFTLWDKCMNAFVFSVIQQQLKKIQARFGADYWYVNTIANQDLAAFAPANVKCILHVHEGLYIMERNSGKDFLQTKGRWHRVVTVAQGFQELLEKAYQTKVLVLPSLLLEEDFQDIKLEKKVGDLPKVFSSGYLNHMKGADLFFALSQEFKGRASFIWLGNFSESYFSALYKELYNKGVYPNLQVISNLHGKDYLSTLNHADVFLFCSRDESMGMVGMEAIRLGIPVLSTPSGGPSTYLNEANGQLLKSFDLKEISTSLENILNRLDQFPAEQVKKSLALPSFEACFAEVKSQIFD